MRNVFQEKQNILQHFGKLIVVSIHTLLNS